MKYHQETLDKLDAARQEIETLKQERWQRGYTSGYNDGVQDGRRTAQQGQEKGTPTP